MPSIGATAAGTSDPAMLLFDDLGQRLWRLECNVRGGGGQTPLSLDLADLCSWVIGYSMVLMMKSGLPSVVR